MKKRLLLISDIAPTSEFTAGIVLERIIEALDSTPLIKFFIIHDRSLGNYTVSRLLGHNELYWTNKPKEDWKSLSGIPSFIKKIGESLAESDADEIVSYISARISRERPDHIIFVIQGQTSIYIANSIKTLNLPTTYIHWDIWDWWSDSHGVSNKMDTITRGRLSNITSAGFHLVPSEEYADFYGISPDKFMVLLPSMIDEIIIGTPQSSDKIEIAFAGQGYADLEISKFISALDSMNWSIGEQKIVLKIFGNTQITSMNQNATIVNLGWFNYAHLPRAMANCHLAFLPYPSGAMMEKVASTSLPSKLAAYASANLPVIYVGPKPTPTSIIAQEIGIALDSKVGNFEISKAIAEILHRRTDFQEKNSKLFNSYFSGANFRKSLNEWLTISNLGELPMTKINVTPKNFLRNIESYEPFEEVDNKKSEIYFSILWSIRHPKKIAEKIGKRIFKVVARTLK